MLMADARRYLLQMLTLALALVGALALANLAVDPLAWRPDSHFDLYSTNDRAVKAHRIRLYEHDGILIGSSKVNRIDVNAIAAPRLFNAAFNKGQPEQFLEFLTRYSHKESLVLLGLDFHMIREPQDDFDGHWFEAREQSPLHGHSLRQWLEYLCSLETTGLSAGILANVAMGAPAKYSMAGNAIFEIDYTNHSAYSWVLERLENGPYQNFRYSVKRVEAIKAIKTWAAAHNVRLLVFLNPINADEASLLRRLAMWPLVLRYRHDMQEIFPELVDFTEAYPDPSNYFPNDPFHYLPQTGVRIVKDVLAARTNLIVR